MLNYNSMETVNNSINVCANEGLKSWDELKRKVPFEFTNGTLNEIVNDAVNEALKEVNNKASLGVLNPETITENELREEVRKNVVEALSKGRYTNELFKALKPSNFVVSEQTGKWIERYNRLQMFMGRLNGIISEIEMDDFAPNTDKLENELMQCWKNYDRLILTGLSMSINDVRGFEDCPEWLI